MSDKIKHVSASSIAAFKCCPTKYRIAYVEALRPAVDAEPLRLGTAWHRGLEILSMPTGAFINEPYTDPPRETTITEENRLEIAVREATAIYDTVPDWADPTDWAVEREVIANALAAYHWLYPQGMSEYETVATELEFELPLRNPETGHSTPNFVRVGKIDRIIRSKATGAILIQENKTTGKGIDSGSSYWDRLRKDTQSKFYIQAARDLQTSGGCEQMPMALKDTDIPLPFVAGLLHDVFHKPTIRPSKLTQGESAEFVRTGDYCGQHFVVVQSYPISHVVPGGTVSIPVTSLSVDGVLAEVELGAEPKPTKKDPNPAQKFAVRETPAMYGARLLQDITQRPEFYFARREIAFTDAELKNFEYQVWALQRNMAEMERTGFYYENEQQCEATFKCPYCVLCYQNVDVYHGQTPPGFKRLHVEEAEQTEATVE
jgi:hypothetical protein